MNLVNLLKEHAKGNTAATYVLACAVRCLDTQVYLQDPTIRERFGDYFYICLETLDIDGQK